MNRPCCENGTEGATTGKDVCEHQQKTLKMELGTTEGDPNSNQGPSEVESHP
jgi:hypothetical protein